MDGTLLPLTFRGFRFHPDTGRLEALDGTATVLRPKTAALLLHLLGRRGAVVPKDELLDAVWPDVTVTEDSITQCVGEIRRAMGEEGRFLRTLPRRGYVLEVGEGADGVAAGAAVPTEDPPSAARTANAQGVPTPRWARRVIGAGIVVAAILALWLRGPPPGAPTPLAAAPPLIVSPATPAGPGVPDPKGEAARLTDEARRLITAPGNSQTNWLNARTLAERAIALDPTNPAPHAHIVPTYTNMVLNRLSRNPAADLREAEQHAERAVALGAHLSASHASLGAVLRLQQRWADARVAYLRAVELDPTQNASRANAGFMLLLLGDPDGSLPGIRATLSIAAPDHAFRSTWYTYLGLAELHRERWAEAVPLLRASLGGRAFLAEPIRVALLAAAMAGAGEDATATRATAEEARRLDPNLTLGWFRENPLSRHPAYLAREEPVLRMLAQAGFPE